jgi:hypothetical protein
MAATPADGETLDPLRGTYSITNWYDCCRPLFIDLVGDYAGKELFLIEGDSLLRECFEDSRIDFKGKLPSQAHLSFFFPPCYKSLFML